MMRSGTQAVLFVLLITTSQAHGVLGDLNRDGAVDFDDFFIFADNFGESGPVEMCDAPLTDTPLVFAGSGQVFTALFTLDSGLTTLTFERESPDCCFTVRMLESPSGDAFYGASLGDTESSIATSKAFKADAGTYVINVDATGAWVLTLDRGEALESADGPSVSLSGSDVQVTDKFTLPSGLRTIRAIRTGTSCCFTARLLDAQTGDRLYDASLSDTDGLSEISKAFQVEEGEAGEYVANVDTKGGWTIEIE